MRSRIGHGGVARNVAENLARLGCRVSLASLIGADPAGAELKTAIEATGVDSQYLRIVTEARTAEYTAVFHGGELFAAFADMDIFEAWPASWIDELAPALRAHSWVFADCNLPQAALARLRKARKSISFRLAVDAVSVAKSARLGADLSQIDFLFLNRDEARALTGTQEALPAMRRLRERGAAAVVLTEGPAGVHGLADGPALWVAAPAVARVNVSGAGDALIAGTVLRLAEGASLADAVEFGAACAAFTVSSPGAVATRMSRENVARSFLPQSGLQRSDDSHER